MINVLYNICFALGLIVAGLFAALVLITGKGDAMSGGGAVRTTFKGKANFDDIMSRATLYLGIAFLVLMLGVDIIGNVARNNENAGPAASAPPAPASPAEKAK